jgi:hypothetical protein
MPFLIESNLMLMPFLVIYVTCSCIDLIMDAMFWHSAMCQILIGLCIC